MLRSDLTSHRRSSEPELIEALRRREPLALAEACSRTLPVAFAVGRRLLPSTEVEALLLAVYEELWSAPPSDVGLERWVRSRTSALGLAELRGRGAAPALPSVLTIAPDLPAPKLSYLDTTERTLEALDDEDRLALLRAHDEGIPSEEQEAEGAGRSLVQALRALADPDAPVLEDDVEADGHLADWVLGLVGPEEAAALDTAIAGDPVRGARVQVLRRGRRRIEGLPPTPDLGPRLLAAVLTGLPADTTAAPGGDRSPSADAGTTSAVDPYAGSEDDTGEIDVVSVAGSDRRTPVGPTPEARAAGTAGETPSVLGPPDESDPTAAGDVAAADVTGEDTTVERGSALGDAPEATGEDWAEDLPSALREDPYADLRSADDEPVERAADRDPYAALRDGGEGEDTGPLSSGVVDPDDPFADLREPGEDEAEPRTGDAEEADGSRSALARFLQIVGILVLIAGGIGLGLLLGQVASSALRG